MANTRDIHGFSNWQTFSVWHWIVNNEAQYNHLKRLKPKTGFEADCIKTIVSQHLYPKGTPNMVTEAEYADVNWHELTYFFNNF